MARWCLGLLMKLFAAWSLIYYFFKFSPLKRKLKLQLRTLYLRLRLQTLKARTLNLRLRLQTLKGRTLKAAKTVTTFRQSLSASKSTQKSVKNLTFLSQRSYLKRFVFIYALVSCVEISNWGCIWIYIMHVEFDACRAKLSGCCR